MRLPVLLYHHVGPARPGTYPWLTVSARRFERHMRWLAQCGYVGIRPADWLAWCSRQTPLPGKPVLVTFDDAYADLVEHAFPVLLRCGFGAAVFVVTGRIGGENTWDSESGSTSHRLMAADQIREWADRGIEFGSHSRTHSDLRMLSNEELDAEIQGSCDELSAVVGRRTTSFAYPYGHFNDEVLRRVRHACGIALSCGEGLNTRSTDLHQLHRSMVQSHDSAFALACRVRLGRNPVQDWRARLRIRSRIRHAAARLAGSEP